MLMMRLFSARSVANQAGIFRILCADFFVTLGIACSVLCALPAVANPSVTSTPDEAADTAWRHAAPLAAAYTPFIGHGAAQQEDDAKESYGYNWRGASPEQPDWRGVRRDIGYFLGYQFAAVAVLYIAPESISGWDSEEKENYSFDKWRDNVSNPVRDEDRWWINYVLHPYWGGTYYIQARERGLDRTQAFWYSALLSTLFEYGAEALAEPVSVQDLVVTPVVGALVGEYLFSPLRQRIRAKSGKLDWSDKAILVATDPLGVMSAETDRLLGVKTTLRWQPIGMRRPATDMDSSIAGPPGNSRGGMPVWGLQFRADW